jgi:hypothetical protein
VNFGKCHFKRGIKRNKDKIIITIEKKMERKIRGGRRNFNNLGVSEARRARGKTKMGGG